jgi:hypothetical protein
VGQGISQTEKAISSQNTIPDGVLSAPPVDNHPFWTFPKSR